MWKRKKAKTKTMATTQCSLAVPSGLARAGNGEAAGGLSRSPSAKEMDKAATSSGVLSARQRTVPVRQIDLALGQIVAVFMRSPQHKQYSADLEWLVLPAISGQYRITQAGAVGRISARWGSSLG
jgi:hypothetical protein